MVSFLQKIAPSAESGGVSRDSSGHFCLKVLVIGELGVGKTALAELLATGKPPVTCKPTKGCSVSCLLSGDEQEGGGSAGRPPMYLVELWDISGAATFADFRRLYYKNINGIILVHDLCDKRSIRSLSKWASEVAQEGSFVAPLPDELTSHNIGGLPVPVLIIGNKADRLKQRQHRSGCAAACSTASSSLTGLCRTTGAPAAAADAAQASLMGRCRSLLGWRGGLGQSASYTGSSPDLGSITGLEASAAAGQLDLQKVHAFFDALWVRRYASGSSGALTAAHQFVAKLPAAAHSAAASVNGAGGSGAAQQLRLSPEVGAMDRRLDDDWV